VKPSSYSGICPEMNPQSIVRRRSTLGVALIGLWCGAGCGEVDSATADGRSLRARVVDADSGAPLGGALVSIELGGIYLGNPDTSKGNPHYAIGGRADPDGRFNIPVPDEELGLHVFHDDYLYAPWRIDQGDDFGPVIKAERRRAVLMKPTVSNARAEPSVVDAGGRFRMTADVAAATSDDPLSDETLVIEPTTFFTAALDPPSAGEQGVGFPDGTYSRELDAPAKSGTYEYFVVATSEGCVTSDAVRIAVEAR